MAAEAERVAHRGSDVGLPRLSGHHVELHAWVELVEVRVAGMMPSRIESRVMMLSTAPAAPTM